MKKHEFRPDSIEAYFRAEWLPLTFVTLSGLVYNIGLLFQGVFSFWTVVAIALLACMIYLLVRKNPYDDEHLTQKVSM